MKKLNHIFILLLVVLSVSACVKDRSADIESGEKLKLNISASALVSEIEGIEIKKIRLILFDSKSEKIVLNSTTDNGQIVNDINNNFSIFVPLGEYNYYIVVNEPAEITQKFQDAVGATDKAFLDGLTIKHVEGAVADNTITLQNSGTLTVSQDPNEQGRALGSVSSGNTPSNPVAINLNHTQAKVSLFVRKNNNDNVVINRVDVINTTTESSLFLNNDIKNDDLSYLQSYTPYHNPSVGITITQNAGATVKEGKNYHKIFNNCIIGSKTKTDPTSSTNATSLVIYATYNGTACSYNVPLLSTDGTTSYDITRGVHYNVYVTITKTGAGFMAMVQILDWKDGGTIDVVDKPNEDILLNVSEVYWSSKIPRTADKEYTKRIYFSSNKPYEQISIERPMVDFDINGSPDRITTYLDNYQILSLTELSLPKIEMLQGQKDSTGGWVEVNLKIPPRLFVFSADRTELYFFIKVGNISRKVTLDYTFVNTAS